MRSGAFFVLLLLCCSALQFPLAAFRGVNGKAAYMAKTAAALQDHLNEADVRLINDTIKVLFPRNLMFDFGKATVRPEFLPRLLRFSQVLNDHPRTDILLIGHTDGSGDPARNLELSRRRADSVRMVLIANGVAVNRLNAWGLGGSMPLRRNRTEAQRSSNRRVEFVVLYNFDDSTSAR